MSQQPVRVLFIASYGRSGSTLMDRLAGQVPGCVSVGELRYIWEQGFIENRLCGCGVPFSDCSFWGVVREQVANTPLGLDIQGIISLKNAVDRTRYIPLMAQPGLAPAFARRLREYGKILRQLYASILGVSGAQVVVDSSKDPSYAFLLAAVPGIEVHLVHLVRDSRGVAYSWMKKMIDPGVVGRTEFMHRYSPMRTACWWALDQGLFHWLGRRVRSYVMVRYEDLIEDPEHQLRRILRPVDLGEAPLPFVKDRRVHLGVAHTVSGNPMRFQQGWVDLRRDDAWREQMKLPHKALVTALTLPGLARYGYLGRASG